MLNCTWQDIGENRVIHDLFFHHICPIYTSNSVEIFLMVLKLQHFFFSYENDDDGSGGGYGDNDEDDDEDEDDDDDDDVIVGLWWY